MSKYINYQQPHNAQKKRTSHPVWQGIGFLMMVLIPVGSWFGSQWILAQNQIQSWVKIPPDLINTKLVDPLLIVKIILTIALAVAIYGLYSIITMGIYSIFFPQQNSPYDVPRSVSKKKSYKR